MFTARGSCTGLVTVGIGLVSLFYTTNDPSIVEIKNTWLPKLTHYNSLSSFKS